MMRGNNKFLIGVLLFVLAVTILFFSSFFMTSCTVEDGETPTSQTDSNVGTTESQSKQPADIQNEEKGSKVNSGAVVSTRVSNFKYSVEIPTHAVNVPKYEVEKGLANVNLGKLGEEIGNYQENYSNHPMELLERNYFYIEASYPETQVYKLYSDNSERALSSFITTDSVLHTYARIFESILENVEEKFLIEEAANMTNNMLKYSISAYSSVKDTEFEAAAKKNMAFFAVASALLGNKESVMQMIPEELKSIVQSELELIDEQGGIIDSPILSMNHEEPMQEDYSQYKPRSHYTNTEELKRYFKAMMWYGRASFSKKSDDDMRSVILMTVGKNSEGINQYWNDIYSITEFFVGSSDDVSMDESTKVLIDVLGENFSLETAINEENAGKLITALKETRAPKINSMIVEVNPEDNPNYEEDRAKDINTIRFMGQRYILDGEIIQNLIYSKVLKNPAGEKRQLPKSIDVAAAFGSDLATDLLENAGDFEFENYPENMQKMKDLVSGIDEGTWESNLYYGWLSSLKTVIDKTPEGYPAFMTTDAWMKKKLNTFLGNYTELKHNTVLYAKQPYADCEGACMLPEEIEMPKGYVEPEVELYAKCAGLARATREGLEDMELIFHQDKMGLQKFEEVCSRLAEISVKELEGTVLDTEDYEFIDGYGDALWEIFDRCIIDYDADEEYNAAIVTDIATDPEHERVLHEGNTGFDTIYVIVPVEGEPTLTKGLVYSNREFETGLDRMTDEEWRENIWKYTKLYPRHKWLDDVTVQTYSRD